MSAITITAARQSDLEALDDLMYQLHDEHHRQSPALFKTASEIAQEKSIERYLHNPDCWVYVARLEESGEAPIIGFITGHFCELISSVSQPVLMGSVDELYVQPDYRQRGVARQLCQRIERSFQECGVTQTFVEVWHFNVAAQTLYQSLGFNHHIHWLRKPMV